MNWIDLKVRKPSEADEDGSGRVFWRCQSGYTFCGRYNNARTDLVAWMPIPEFTPLPDPPEGYEILTDYEQPVHPQAMFYNEGHWGWVFEDDTYNEEDAADAYFNEYIYAVPIKPPEPQYRPFANADEFRPYRERWWKQKGSVTVHSTRYYDDEMHDTRTWYARFSNYEFEDGTPFGIKIN